MRLDNDKKVSQENKDEHHRSLGFTFHSQVQIPAFFTVHIQANLKE